MKKMLLMLLLILPLLGCVKEAEKPITIKDNYEDGEEITIDYVTYRYYSDDSIFNLKPFSFNNPESLNSIYYTDMSNTNQEEISNDLSFYETYPLYGNYDYINIIGHSILVYGNGFLAVDCDKEYEGEITILKKIGKFKVLGLGYNCFNNAKVKSIILPLYKEDTSEEPYFNPRPVICPYAISNCPNLEYINLGNTLALSMAVNNCSNLSEIEGLRGFCDATLYNLPQLTTLTDVDLGMYVGKTVGDDYLYPVQSGFIPGNYFGFKKSMFYNCPNISNVESKDTFWIRNTLYYLDARVTSNENNDYIYYTEPWPIYLRETEKSYPYRGDMLYLPIDNLLIMNEFFQVAYDLEKAEFYLPCLNNGYSKDTTIEVLVSNYNKVKYEVIDNKLKCQIKYADDYYAKYFLDDLGPYDLYLAGSYKVFIKNNYLN